MPSTTLKRRWTEEGMKGRLPKKQRKIKRQREYHSSSEDEEGVARDAPQVSPQEKLRGSIEKNRRHATGANSQPRIEKIIAAEKSTQQVAEEEESPSFARQEDFDQVEEQEEEEEEDDDDDDTNTSETSDYSDISETSTNNMRRVRKRNDPEAFATSISRILGTKLTSQKRSEPILSRSKSAQETNKSLSDHKLTIKANRTLLAEKKAAQEKGRVKDVLGLQKEDVSTADIVAEEKRLRRTAQKGVIKLFNAVRAAQVKAELAEKEARQKGVVGITQRDEKIKEMSKQGFLDMISGCGQKKEGSVDA